MLLLRCWALVLGFPDAIKAYVRSKKRATITNMARQRCGRKLANAGTSPVAPGNLRRACVPDNYKNSARVFGGAGVQHQTPVGPPGWTRPVARKHKQRQIAQELSNKHS